MGKTLSQHQLSRNRSLQLLPLAPVLLKQNKPTLSRSQPLTATSFSPNSTKPNFHKRKRLNAKLVPQHVFWPSKHMIFLQPTTLSHERIQKTSPSHQLPSHKEQAVTNLDTVRLIV